MSSSVIYTIGHSNRSFDEFVRLLDSFKVECVVDIRTVPKSRTNPQYNIDLLPDSLNRCGITYRQLPKLGGLRKKSTTIAENANAYWENRGFHNYADYALSPAFAEGLGELITVSKTQQCVIMCAEAVWWRCHRRIVSDYLLIRGIPVFHIMEKAKSSKATLTPAARPQELKVLYPRPEEKVDIKSLTT
ncbi:DUF488 domain-containing protein [Pseudomonas juntendi]|nr:DUF488 domain-containing protein [Pseudomonas juntendi]